MRYLFWIPGAVVFITLLGFAAKNSEMVPVHFFFGLHWNVPMVMVMFCFFVGGVVLGVSGALASLFLQRIEIARLRRVVGRDEES